jgi:radical SAM superfamily enzyme YgiQ (UPF0313 family)
MLLIHPPVTKPSEPPVGIARLSGALSSQGVKHRILDLNLECLLALLSEQTGVSDTWTTRARRNLSKNIDTLRSWRGYTSVDRYKRAIADLHRLFQTHATSRSGRLTFSDFQHPHLSPLRSSDLLNAAKDFEENLFFPYFSSRIEVLTEQINARVIGFSLNYLSQALCTFAMIGFVRKRMPGVKIVIGGSLVTSWVRGNAWKNQFHGIVDYVVAGPGERRLLSILGIIPKEGEYFSSSFGSFPINQYLAPGPIIPYSSSTGCYWGQCSFCPEKAEGNAYSQIPGKTVAEELQTLVSETKPVLVHLTDNAVSPALMMNLCSNPPGAPWYGFSRLTNHLANPAFCVALRDSGCVMLKLGLESGSQIVLDSMQKGNDVEQASDALKSLKKAGIATYVYLLFGTPQETALEAQETLEFVARHSPYIDFLNIAVFNLPVRSPETSELHTRGFYDGNLSLYTDFIHPEGWDRKHVKQFLDKKLRRHPAIQPILRRYPMGFGSNHAPLFVMQNEGENAYQNPVK